MKKLIAAAVAIAIVGLAVPAIAQTEAPADSAAAAPQHHHKGHKAHKAHKASHKAHGHKKHHHAAQ